jgi:methyl-accepting chemotaxis protein
MDEASLVAAVGALFGTLVLLVRDVISHWKSLYEKTDEKLEATRKQAADDARTSAERIDRLTDKMTEMGASINEIVKRLDTIPRRREDWSRTER